jgi:hypothetical protein
MSEEPRRLIPLGSYESGSAHVIVPAPAIRKVEAVFDREREKREREAAKAKLQIMQQVRGRTRLKKALKLCFGRGRRGR